MAKFNLSQFKNGKAATNKLHQVVTFIVESRGKMICKVKMCNGQVESSKYNLDGSKFTEVISDYDLMMA